MPALTQSKKANKAAPAKPRGLPPGADPCPVTAWLEANGKSQQWLAGKLRVSESIVSKLCTGTNMPRAATLLALEKLTGVSAATLLHWRAALR